MSSLHFMLKFKYKVKFVFLGKMSGDGIHGRMVIVLSRNQWRNDRGAEGGSCPRAQQSRGRKIGGAKVGFIHC